MCECTSCSHRGPAAAGPPHPSSRSSAIWSSQLQNAAGGEGVPGKYGVRGAGVNLPSLGNQVPDPVGPGGELVSTDPQTGTPAPGPRPPGASRQGQVTWTTVRPDRAASVQTPGASVQTVVRLSRPPGRTDTRAPRHPFLVLLHPCEGRRCHLPTGLPPREGVDSALKVVSVPLRGAQADSPLTHCL